MGSTVIIKFPPSRGWASSSNLFIPCRILVMRHKHCVSWSMAPRSKANKFNQSWTKASEPVNQNNLSFSHSWFTSGIFNCDRNLTIEPTCHQPGGKLHLAMATILVMAEGFYRNLWKMREGWVHLNRDSHDVFYFRYSRAGLAGGGLCFLFKLIHFFTHSICMSWMVFIRQIYLDFLEVLETQIPVEVGVLHVSSPAEEN